MHRFTAFLLAALLLAGLCVPAMAAAETADVRLARVTQSVKDTLDLDTEQYPDFRGYVYEQELGTVWSLGWSGSDSSMTVEALEDGTIVRYWRDDASAVTGSYGGSLPAFPQIDTAKAKAAAEAFLKRVLDSKTESVELGEPASSRQLNATTCRFNGTILLNKLPSPLAYSISVRGEDNSVTSFYRDAPATSFLGNIPSPTPAVAQSAAASTLKGTLKLELVYVVSEDDETQAVLRYVPKDYTEQYVDAQTGKLVTPNGDMILYAGASNATAEAAEDAGSMKRALTQAELAGIEKMEGVLDSEALDKLIRAESAYQLGGFTVASANYRLVKEGANETEAVLCTLRYTAPADEDGFAASRTFTVDARTGEVRSVYSGARWDKDRKSAVSVSAAQSAAEGFLKRFTAHGDLALCDTQDNTADGAPFYGFTFARRVNGYFFPENVYSIQIDRMTGAVAGVSYTYDAAVRFDGTDGIVSEAAALDAWMGTYDVTLAYRILPKELDANVAAEARLIEKGITRFRALFLSYGLERESYVPGVDAKTGKPVEIKQSANEIAYTDAANHWAAKEIGTLAQYGVGYAAEAFRPNKALTQWELVALLVSTRGLRLDPDNVTVEEKDNAYETAYRMGALKRAERSDDAAMNRGGVVRMLLNSAGYAPVAKLSGIFTCSYRDRASIPAADLGYAALSQGFGIVRNESYGASRSATRAEAAVMLCRLMEREA